MKHWEDEDGRNYVMAWVGALWISSLLVALIVSDDYHDAKVRVIGLTVMFLCIEAVIYLFSKAFE